jgi:hypothetical protein
MLVCDTRQDVVFILISKTDTRINTDHFFRYSVIFDSSNNISIHKLVTVHLKHKQSKVGTGVTSPHL